jgi:hypothetical protein
MSTPRRRRRDREPLNEIAGTFATVPTATGDLPDRIERLASDPTHDEIARRAYQLYEARGGGHGRDWNDWFQAERELRQPGVRSVIDRIMGTEGPYAAA